MLTTLQGRHGIESAVVKQKRRDRLGDNSQFDESFYYKNRSESPYPSTRPCDRLHMGLWLLRWKAF